MRNWYCIILAGLFTACASRQGQYNGQLTSIKIVDRNGFNETVSAPDRLKLYECADFFSSQPYEKVVRFYSRNKQGKTPSKLTTYHNNGELWQYLEVMNGRASGVYREWHANGKLRLELIVIEGIGDLNEDAQLSWIFDGPSRVFDSEGHILAEFNYEKGKLQGNALYYHQNGKISKIIPYENDLIHGEILYYNKKSELSGQTPYIQGKRDGVANFKGDSQQPAYSENYCKNGLLEATYHDFSGKIIGSIKQGNGMQIIYENGALKTIREYQNGYPKGKVENYDIKGNLLSFFYIKDDMKHGEEWIYYTNVSDGTPQPKLYIQWSEDVAQGITRTWYLNGILESEREILDGKKHGIASCWYKDGSLMMIEEYENNILCKGTYMKKGDTHPVSTVSDGKGIATLFDAEGIFLKRVSYIKGFPSNEP